MDTFAVAITGASSGIGKALALCYAKEATHLFITGRNTQALSESKVELMALNPHLQVQIHSFDVSDEAAYKRWYKEIFHIRIDVIILNAGIAMGEKECIQRHFEICHTNVMGIMYGTFYALQFFHEQERVRGYKGQIVLISSIAALLALPNAPSYSASKSFVKSLGESLSLRQQDVRITTICPGFIKTPLTDYLHQGIPQMSVQKASRKIYKAIQKGKCFYAFPCYLAWAARFYTLLPLWFKRKLLGGLSFMGQL